MTLAQPTAPAAWQRYGWRSSVSLALGVVLPATTLAVELATELCAQTLFDPLSTFVHVLLVAAVPLGNLWLWHRLSSADLPRWAGCVGGLCLAVAGYYAAVFLPLTLLAVVAIVMHGLGLLALSPLLASLIGLGFAREIKRRTRTWVPLVLGAGAASLLLIAAELPSLVQRMLMAGAISDDTATRVQSIELLRRFGARDALLIACYRARDEMPGVLNLLLAGWAPPVDTAGAREIYYRVTGEPFTAQPAPELRSLRAFDPDQGGTAVGGRVRGLLLRQSRLDASIDAGAAVGYIEWTLVFHNRAGSNAEARAELALPHGGVVSRATLWVGGEPREAAFAGTGQMRAAYQNVARRAPDPLRVTQPTPDRVLLECFPVLPGSEMKVRVGVSFPLQVGDDGRARFELPAFAERNFEFAPSAAHRVWVEANGPLSAPHPSLLLDSDATRVRGDLPAGALTSTRFEVAWPGPQEYHALDPTSAPELGGDENRRAMVIERFVPVATNPLKHLLLVVDASQAMAGNAGALAELLSSSALPLTLVLASDSAPHVERMPPRGPERTARLSRLLASTRMRGGRDNSAALRAAFERARQLGSDSVIWLHGPQPLVLGDPEPLELLFDREPRAPELVPIALALGQNALLHALGGHARVRPPPGRTDGVALLSSYLASRQPEFHSWVAERERIAAGARRAASKPTSAHLVKLWAAEQIAQGCPGLEAEACEALAARHQLVTPVTGAVVL